MKFSIFDCLFLGYYCLAGTEFSAQYPCNNGTFNNITGAQDDTSCQLCTPGYYCPTPGLAEPTAMCDGGYYCILGSWSNQPSPLGNDTISDCSCPAQIIGDKCKAGTFCPPGSDAPTPCTGGYYCGMDELSAESGQCLAGYYCNGSSTLQNPVNETFGDICPKGHYCPTASSYPIPCAEGEYSDAFAQHNISSCLPCTAGKYCQGPGRDLPNGFCDVGWFCPEGSIVPQPPGNECLAGHECPLGSPDQTACSSGYYQPLAGQGQCIICPGGSYCDQNEAINEQQSGGGAPSHGVVTPKGKLLVEKYAKESEHFNLKQMQGIETSLKGEFWCVF